MNQLNQHIEALIFCSEQSISLDEISASLKLTFDWEPAEAAILRSIEEIKAKYEGEEFSFQLVDISEGYQFMTKKEYHATINALIQHKSKKKLSVPQMETLSIIAYRQPITKSEMEHIRGVSCDYAIQKLLEKDLISISGKSDGPGRPVLYTTSQSFMDYFGIRSVKDLPQLKDLHMEQNEIGSSSEYSDAELEDNSPSELLEENVSVNAENETTEINSELPGTIEAGIITEEITAEISEEEIEELPEILAEEEELVIETNDDEMPPIMGEEEDLQIPDRKSIFMENQVEPSDEHISEENTDFRGEADPS
ncbi:MAG: SMC-Scp complex subunit ScpB [Bacteroidetes bacterium]|nr:SMC-Scp complex subunit ScpB [Bacteroidota bacterium]MBK9541478.1 SMC-Scp complex subunit ScpB [Bacteroidota bacterium]MBP6401187.1 SMC-Scp complex subunit ScpB [Bacteroidia bacterium]MBP6648550.1 SMC-Scp complex subunit ScpB [Bacteroidia bacterium]